MGQRAVIAYNDGATTRITTNQWSTILGNMLQNYVDSKREQSDDFDFDAFAIKLFSEITKHNHISVINLADQSYMDQVKEFRGQQPETVTHKVGVLPAKDDSPELFLYFVSGEKNSEPVETTDKEISQAVKEHFHAQDGISIYYTKGSNVIYTYIHESFLKKEDDSGNDLEVPTFCNTPVPSEIR